MRTRAVVLVAVAALAAVALAVPAASASQSTAFTLPAGAPHPEARDGNCGKLRQNAGRMGGGGDHTATCIRRKSTASTTQKAPIPLNADAASNGTIGMNLAAVPAFCTNATAGVWVFDRTRICRQSQFWLDAFDIVSGRYRGTATIYEMIYTYTSIDENVWYTQVNLVVTDILAFEPGAFDGVKFWATFDCVAACWVKQTNFPPQDVSYGAMITGDASFSASVVLPQQPAYGVSGVFYHATPRLPVPDPDPIWMPFNVRCDIKTSADDELTSEGCVVPMWRPVFYMSESAYPQVVHHIRAAINSGLPSTLQRLADRNAARRNGDAACPRSWERPFLHECDEYPFRSTYQGARFERDAGYSGRTHDLAPEPCLITALPTGVTGNRGWSDCWVRAGDNSRAGGKLGYFYKSNRVIDGEWFDVVLAL